MQFTVREKDSKEPNAALFMSLEPLIRGIGMALIDLSVFQGKRGGVQVKAVVMAGGRDTASHSDTGVEDCAKAHRLIMPRLELAFPGKDIYLEVSSPGINRLIKDGSEFVHYIGREVRCYRTDISDWTAGILRTVDEEKIVLLEDGKETILSYETIAKARLGERT
ncbi:MAG: ribosome assembly cofactor RimP [Treponema sp.]|jgi:ribosome maturation factor RimP|nr:ribosome assembly cofactor RimP [Treponema sp.]